MSAEGPGAEGVEFLEEHLITLPEAGMGGIDTTADDHVFWIQWTGDDARLCWDGTLGRPFHHLPQRDGNALVLSPDRRRIAYYGVRDDRVFVGVDSGEEGPYDNVSRSVPPTFSPDGDHLAYGVMTGNDVRLVVDGVVRPETNLAATPVVWSPDSQRLAWSELAYQALAHDGGHPPKDLPKQRIVIDGVAGPWVDAVLDLPGSAVFSPDSQHVAHAIREGKRHSFVVDDRQEQPFDGLAGPVWSRDSRRFAYGAAIGNDRSVIVLEGEAGPPAKWVGWITFSPDSRRLAYAAQEVPGRARVVVDGSSGATYADIWGGVVFSPDSKRVAYIAKQSGSGLLGRFRTSMVLVLDGVEGEMVDEVNSLPHFSPDGAHIAFSGRRGGNWHAFVDGVPGTALTSVGPPQYAAGGQLRYPVGLPDGGKTIVTDGRPGPIARAVIGEDFRFMIVSDDGSHVAWVAQQPDGLHPVLDQTIGPTYDGCGRGRFLDNHRVRFSASRGTQVLRVTATIGRT